VFRVLLCLYWHLWYGRWLCFQHNALQLEDNNFLFRYWFWSSILFKSATFRTLAEARFGAEQENPGERMFSILLSKELWTSVNVLAHEPINKFIRVIFPVNLKLHRIKKIRQNVCDARSLRWNIWEGTFWKLGGKPGVTTFFSSLLRNHEKEKNTPTRLP